VKKLLFGIIILLAGCKADAPPEWVMSEEEMINYLIDLHLSEAAVQNLRLKSDSARVVFAVREKYILKKHQLTDSVFLKSYSYYLKHSEKLEEIYGAVVDSISLRQSLLKEAK